MYYASQRIAASTEANVRVITSTMASSLANGTATPRADDGGVSMNNFYPALVQCFGIIICGLVDILGNFAPR